jgi:hypothetical protein
MQHSLILKSCNGEGETENAMQLLPLNNLKMKQLFYIPNFTTVLQLGLYIASIIHANL